VTLSQAGANHQVNEDDSSVLNYDEKRPVSRVVKTTMGKLYKDKKYLQNLIEDGKFPGTYVCLDTYVCQNAYEQDDVVYTCYKKRCSMSET
jgi:hypothetical protein